MGMAQELFDIGNGLAVNCNPGGRFHGWLFRKHHDGQYVSVRQLDTVTPGEPALVRQPEPLYTHILPSPDACKHDFTGWRDLPDGNGGEQVCAKCGMGAMAYTLATGP